MYNPKPLYVFSALLAVLSLGSCFLPSPPTVPDYVFDAYVKQHDEMEQMVTAEVGKNGAVYGYFEQMKLLYKSSYETSIKSYYDRARLLLLWSNLAVEDLDSMKAGLIMEVEGISREEATAKEYRFEGKRRWVDMDITNDYFRTLDNDGKAAGLKHILQVHRDRLFSDEILFHRRDSLSLLNMYDLESGSQKQTWEEYFFKDRPPISALYELVRWEYQIRAAEKTVLDYLSRKMRSQFYAFDAIKGIIIPKSYTVHKGETFEAEIMLAAFNVSERPEVRVNEKDVSEYVNGAARFREKAVTLGRKKVKGYIYVGDPVTGERIPLHFETEYEVVE